MSDHARNTEAMLATGGAAQKPDPAARAARRRCAAKSAAACTAVRRDRARQGKTERAQARRVHRGCDRRAKAGSGLLGEARKLLQAMK